MSTTAASLVQSARRFLRDWPDQDNLTASVATTGATTVTVADSSRYVVNTAIEIEQEAMIVRALPTATTLTVQRGAYGSTPATHANGLSILIRPEYFTQEYLDAINGAIQATFPWIYKQALDTSLTVAANTWEYTIPNMPGTYAGSSIPIPRLARVDILVSNSGSVPYRPLRAWQVRRGGTPVLKLRDLEVTGSTLRLTGYGPFPDVAFSDSLDAQFPPQATQLLVEMAVSRLMLSGEAQRLRNDSGVRDDREAAWHPGAGLNAAQALEARFLRRLSEVAMSPMESHVVTHQ